jgi:hypothetical protein
MMFATRVRVASLEAENAQLRAQLKAAGEHVEYFRRRYDRLADQLLYREGQIRNPVHTDPPPDTPVRTAIDQIGRVAGRIGNLETRAAHADGRPTPIPIHLVPE